MVVRHILLSNLKSFSLKVEIFYCFVPKCNTYAAIRCSCFWPNESKMVILSPAILSDDVIQNNENLSPRCNVENVQIKADMEMVDCNITAVTGNSLFQFKNSN